VTVIAFGCGVAVSAAMAAQPRRTIDVTRWLDAGAADVPDAGPVDVSRSPADPAPIVARSRWIFDLRWDSGDVWLLGVRVEELPSPRATPHAMGRFAIELYEGPTVIERVRFDFPLLGAAEPDAGVSLSRRLRTSIGVYVPVTSRGTRLLLVDRATSSRWELPWPPREPIDAGAAMEEASVGMHTN
jgi:hypothetical protein